MTFIWNALDDTFGVFENTFGLFGFSFGVFFERKIWCFVYYLLFLHPINQYLKAYETTTTNDSDAVLSDAKSSDSMG